MLKLLLLSVILVSQYESVYGRSIVFVFDTTGSMHDDLRQLREGAERILDAASKGDNDITNFVFVPFHDPSVGPPTVTDDKNIFKAALDKIRVKGGGDCPEKSMSGLSMALNVSQPESYIYVFTDATAGDHDLVGDVLDLVQRKRSQVVFVLTGHCGDVLRPSYQVYRRVAAASSGQLFNLNKTGVAEVLEFVRSSLLGRRVNLGGAAAARGHNYTRDLPVDGALAEVTVSVSGAGARVTVAGPRGAPPPPRPAVDMPEIKVLKLYQPMAGNWTLSVGGDDSYWVTVAGVSNVTFRHGFSVHRPARLEETSHRPLLGAPNFLLLSLLGGPLRLRSAELLATNGTRLRWLPAARLDDATYVTDAFVPPAELFYVAISGVDELGHEVRRVAPAAVRPTLPAPPYVRAPAAVAARAGERVALPCRVESLVAVVVGWTRRGRRVGPTVRSDQSTVVEHTIPALDAATSGEYRCVAVSALGRGAVATRLQLIVDPPKISMSDNATYSSGDEATVQCRVSSDAPVDVRIVNGLSGNSLDISRNSSEEDWHVFEATFTAEEDAAVTCTAVNEGGATTETTWIHVHKHPTAHIEGAHNITQLLRSRFELTCSIERGNTVKWLSPNRTVVKEELTQSSQLVIEELLFDHEGEWTCVTFNGLNEAHDLIHLTILTPPRVEIQGSRKPLLYHGLSYNITCDVQANPEPITFIWYTGNGTVLSTETETLSNNTYRSALSLRSVSRDAVGTYVCYAENELGFAQRDVLVTTRRNMTVTAPLLDKTVDIDTEVKLACAVDSYPAATIQWYHNNTLVSLNVSQDYHKIERVGLNDSGLYSCVAKNKYEQLKLTAILTVVGVDPPKISMSDNATYSSGDEATVQCRVSSDAPVDVRIVNGLSGNSLDISSNSSKENWGVFEATFTAEDDAAVTCTAVNEGGATTETTWIHVHKHPTAHIDGAHNITQLLRSRFELTCSIERGNTVKWLSPNRTVVKEELTQSSQLVIDELLFDHDGDWTCVTFNGLNEAHDSIHLTILTPPRVEIQGSRKPLLYHGLSYNITCDVQAKPEPMSFIWYTGNGTVLSTETETLSNNTYRSALSLRSVSRDAVGTYVCYAENELGFAQRDVLVTTRRNMTVTAPLLDKTVDIDTEVKLTCAVESYPAATIQWYHNNTLVSLNGSQDYLMIEHVGLNDSGLYSCVAKNKYEELKLTATLTVVGERPQLSKEPVRRYAKRGTTTILACRVLKGRPVPTIKWEFKADSSEDFNNIPKDINVMNGTNELLIPNVTLLHGGTFRCSAENYVGTDEYESSLVVQYPPSVQSASQTVSVLEGTPVELPCAAAALPPPTVLWRHNGADVLADDRRYVDEAFALRFVANLTDFGEYECIATNRHGNASLTHSVYVWVAPTISAPRDTVADAASGDGAALACSAVGFPVPVVRWEYDGRPLPTNTSHYSFNEVGNLNISDVTSSLAGVYTCLAENAAGVAAHSVLLRVWDAPKILEDNFTGPYIGSDRDRYIKLPCRATGKPDPLIVWSLNGKNITNDDTYVVDGDGSLTIKSPRPALSGAYSCEAANALGRARARRHVLVYALPTTPSEARAVTASVGARLSLACPAAGAGNFSVQWYKDAKLISTGSLTLNVTRRHAGAYACVASNELGSGSADVRLDVHWSPEFRRSPSLAAEAAVGEDVVLDCEVDANPPAEIQWRFNSTVMVGEDSPRLRLARVLPHHGGTYACTATNALGAVARTYSLVVYEPPFISDFDVMDVTLKEGRNATLECHAKGTPTPNVTWIFNNTHWRLRDDASLHADHVTASHAGALTCRACSGAGAARLTYRVRVVGAPRVEELVAFGDESETVLDDVDLLVGKDVRISCYASGSPAPEIRWIKDGNVIAKEEGDFTYVDLILKDVKAKDEGYYTCVASNEGGMVERRIKVSVLEPPRISTTPYDDPVTDTYARVQTLSGRPVRLTCRAYGNPAPQLYWFRNGTLLKLYDENMTTTDFGEVLVASEASAELAGNYTCVARSRLGEAKYTYLLEVLEPPTPSESEEHVRVLSGQPLRMSCPCAPGCAVTWLREPDAELSETLSARIKITDNNATLTIDPSQPADSGTYTCVRVNAAGAATRVYRAGVLASPAGGARALVARVGRAVALRCDSDATPPLLRLWTKDGAPFEAKLPRTRVAAGGAALTVAPLRPADAGVYVCGVTNAVGAAALTFSLTVRVPGAWSPWSAWGVCDAACGRGRQTRARVCRYADGDVTVDSSYNVSLLALDEAACVGRGVDTRVCHAPACESKNNNGCTTTPPLASHPTSGKGNKTPYSLTQQAWSAWSPWDACDRACGAGTQTRRRTCEVDTCHGDNVQIRKCPNLPPCYSSQPPESTADDYNNNDNDNDNENDNYNDNDNGSDDDAGNSREREPLEPYLPEDRFPPPSDYSDVEEFYINTDATTPQSYEVDVSGGVDAAGLTGPCPAGFRRDAATDACEDINECLPPGACHATQRCVNTRGGYRCSCPRGYRALAAGQRCLDINECLLRARCSHACVNTAGGFTCACPPRLRLRADRRTCAPPSYIAKRVADDNQRITSLDYPAR